MTRYVVEVRHPKVGEKYLVSGHVAQHYGNQPTLFEWPVIIDEYEVTGYAYSGDPGYAPPRGERVAGVPPWQAGRRLTSMNASSPSPYRGRGDSAGGGLSSREGRTLPPARSL